MESRRRQRWDNSRRSKSRRPPRSWQPMVPSWEKEFCRVVGSVDWGRLLQMKKFVHLYDNVISWNDSAGQEAFCNAKKRFWAEINGLSCDIPLPDPDLYIDKINWDSENDHQKQLVDFECKPVISNTEEHHEPVVIFGDSLIPDQEFCPAGWGDNEENFRVPLNCSSSNHVDPWEQSWGNSFNNRAPSAWPGYYNNAWGYSNGSGPAGYLPWDGGWNDSGWSYGDNHYFNYVGPDIENKIHGVEQGQWNGGNFWGVDVDRYMSSYRSSRIHGNDHYQNQILNS